MNTPYLICYMHQKEIFRRAGKLWHIEGDLPVVCDDQLFICNAEKHPYTRDGVIQWLPLYDPIAEIKRRKRKGDGQNS